MGWFSQLIGRTIAVSHSSWNGKIEVKDIRGHRTLLADGIQQTGPYPNRLWDVGLKDILTAGKAPINILVFGVGGGYVFKLLNTAFPQAMISGVDIDPEIIRLSRQHFGLDAIPHLHLVCQDAKTFVQRKSEQSKYDLVVIDLYVANDVPGFVTQESFLRSVSRFLRPRGRLVINYFHARNQEGEVKKLASKLSRCFSKVEYQSVLRNIFFTVVK